MGMMQKRGLVSSDSQFDLLRSVGGKGARMQFVSVAKKYSLDVYRFAARALGELFPESTIRVIVLDHQIRDFEKSLPRMVVGESELDYDSGFLPHSTMLVRRSTHPAKDAVCNALSARGVC